MERELPADLQTVPPVYYADQACERAKLHVREQQNGDQVLGQVHKDLKYAMVCELVAFYLVMIFVELWG
jgi:hypothetical protein